MSGEISGNGLDLTFREFVSGQKLFNRYRLIKALGRGGMGIVWLARDDELERDVALKFLPDLVIHDRTVLNDLKRETRRSLELTHKNIVRIYDFVHDERSGCISMEYVDGDTLSNLRADKPKKVFEPEELKEWLSELCDALEYAHGHAQIVHRDLKPANLMVNQRGDLKVADFGIARSLSDSISLLTMERGKSGTLVYMSPQQLDGERGTPLDDIYSLGASIYELLTSRPPFYSGNVDRQIREKVPPTMTLRRQQLEVEAGPIDPGWEKVIARCLSKDPQRRPQSVREVAGQLGLFSTKTTSMGRPSVGKKSKWGGLAGIVALIMIIGAAAWYFGMFPQTRKEAAIATDATSSIATKPAPTIVPVASAAPPAGGVIINTSPSGAAVMLGGKEMGKTPVTLKDLPPGKHPIRLLLDGYDVIEKPVDVKENEFTNVGTITLSRARAGLELSSVPPGAKVVLDDTVIGTTPMRRDDLTPGTATYVLFLDGYLPREVRANLDPKQIFRREVPLTPVAPAYAGTIHQKNLGSSYSVPLTITLASDSKSGTMTQSGKRGDFVVRFAGIWDGTALRAVTGEVISQPSGIQWAPESFTLRFGDDGKTASYECISSGKTYVADLSGQSASAGKASLTYKGTIRPSAVPLTISLAADRKSGTMTQTGKHGDFVVTFMGVLDGTALHAVTRDVVSQPPGIKWEPESFTLRFGPEGKSAYYECVAGNKTYSADLSAQSVAVTGLASVYKGTIRKDGESSGSSWPLTITFATDRNSGTETQSSRSGDVVVKFNGVWDGKTLRAVTDEVVMKPRNVQWKPESFALRFAEDWKTASYECNSEGNRFTAQLAAP